MCFDIFKCRTQSFNFLSDLKFLQSYLGCDRKTLRFPHRLKILKNYKCAPYDTYGIFCHNYLCDFVVRDIKIAVWNRHGK